MHHHPQQTTANVSNIIDLLESQVPQLFQHITNTQQPNNLQNCSQNNAQIPQIPSYNQGSHIQQTQRIIQCPVVPNLKLVPAKERLLAQFNKTNKDIALVRISQLSIEQLTKQDMQGDTQLMILIANEKCPMKLEYLSAMVNRLKREPGALETKNKQHQSAFFLACMFMYNQPVAVRFIAETLVEINSPINEVYNKGNTLLHYLCAWGDIYLDVVVELLSMKDSQGRPYFDVNRHNHHEGTPLHVAVKKHSKDLNCSATIAFLLQNGADVLQKERCSGKTALHMAVKEACDPLVVKILLNDAAKKGIDLVNEEDYPRDMALHHAALRNDIPVRQQENVIQLLMDYGAMSNKVGSQGRMPLALVSAERKNGIQRIIRRR